MFEELPILIQQRDYKALARGISLIENEAQGYNHLLLNLPENQVPVIGITGPPGAGKSTLTDCLIKEIISAGKTAGVLCIDPSSPFNAGALLGDRIRMSEWYTHPAVFIRSLASRGSLGGLNPMILEITDLVKAGGFDYIIIETVGVGQSEIEIAGLADVTIVVLVPEGGDEIQTMKAGLMETGDIFVVNKADRPGADSFAKELQKILHFNSRNAEAPVLQAIGREKQGIDKLYKCIIQALTELHKKPEKQFRLLAEKAYHLIRNARMRDISKQELYRQIENELTSGKRFNLYRFVADLSGNN